MLPLILGSTSPYRRALLQRVGLPFTTCAPDIDERRHPGESPQALVQRLAEAKSRAVALRYPAALIIGSDQVACVEGEVLGKPGDRERAIQQLAQAAGKRVSFFTGLCLLNSAAHRAQVACEAYHVHFRPLDHSRIERYVDREQPFNCAGSFKSEGLGITLFERLEGDDPNTLVGLPLIRLVDMLAREGISVP